MQAQGVAGRRGSLHKLGALVGLAVVLVGLIGAKPVRAESGVVMARFNFDTLETGQSVYEWYPSCTDSGFQSGVSWDGGGAYIVNASPISRTCALSCARDCRCLRHEVSPEAAGVGDRQR